MQDKIVQHKIIQRKINGFFASLAPYCTQRIRVTFVMGFASGLPILMTLSTLAYWLAKFDVNKTQIGMLALTGLPYTLKFLWSPFLDYFNAPIFSGFGKRKGWIILFQCILLLIFIALSFVNPKDHISWIALLIVCLSFASASQDILIDAYRIDWLTPDEQAYGVGATQMGYRIAMLVTGVGMLSLSDFIDWSWLFLGLAGLMFLVLVYTLFIPEPPLKQPLENQKQGWQGTKKEIFYRNINKVVVQPFRDFLMRHPQALWILLFILCFKLPDVVSGIMVSPFYTAMGFTGVQIGAVTKVYGFIPSFVGIFIGSILVKPLGLYRTLFISSMLLGLSNFSYLLIVYSPTVSSLIWAILIENMAGGIASATFIMFLSLLCNQQYSATQYALLSSLAAVSVRVLGPVAGGMADALAWDQFFMITAILFIPALLLLVYIKNDVRMLVSSVAPAMTSLP